MHAISGWQVSCLCAAWCRSCDDYRAVFDAVAADFPDWRFSWVDIEDRSDLLDDYDVQTFPTLLVGHEQTLRFAGALTPHAQTLTRLLGSLAENPAARVSDEAAQQLWQRLRQAGD